MKLVWHKICADHVDNGDVDDSTLMQTTWVEEAVEEYNKLCNSKFRLRMIPKKWLNAIKITSKTWKTGLRATSLMNHDKDGTVYRCAGVPEEMPSGMCK